MALSILFVVAVVASVVVLSYRISSSFWSSDYSRTNTSGDFGSPRGGVFAIGLIGVLGAALISLVGPHLAIPPQVLAAGFIGSFLGGMVSGMVAAFRAVNKSRKK